MTVFLSLPTNLEGAHVLSQPNDSIDRKHFFYQIPIPNAWKRRDATSRLKIFLEHEHSVGGDVIQPRRFLNQYDFDLTGSFQGHWKKRLRFQRACRRQDIQETRHRSEHQHPIGLTATLPDIGK